MQLATSIKIDAQDVPVYCIKSRRNKRLTAIYCPKRRGIVVRLPFGAGKKHVLKLLSANQDHFVRFIRAQRNLKHSDSISIMGQSYTIRCERAARPYYTVKNQEIMIGTATGDDINSMIKHFARKELRRYLDTQVPLYADKIAESYNGIFVKNMFSQWGSCSSKRNLNFSLNLAFAPVECIDYVIAHEVCHLKHMNHSPQFWDLVKQVYPTYQQSRQQLKQLLISL